jgi:CheY-like chemotaxis protein
VGRKPIIPGEPRTERVSLVFSGRELEAIDEWRRTEPALPSRSHAVRELISRSTTLLGALACAEANGGRKVKKSAGVLIIDPDPLTVLALRIVVEGMGHRVIGTASTRADALKIAKREPPDVVLAETQLPDGPYAGLEATNEIIAARPALAICVTYFPERYLTRERPEPSYLVAKPILPENIEIVIRQGLEGNQQARSPRPRLAVIDTPKKRGARA